MGVVSPCATVFHRLAAMIGLFCLATSAGCGDHSPEARARIELAPGDGWTKVANTRVVVPGTTVSAWTGPEGSSLAIYSSLPIPSPDADALRKEIATRWLNLPGVSIEASTVETYSGVKAARVEAVGPGTGDAFVPSGIGKPVTPEGKTLLPTRRIAVSFPRQIDTLTLIWHFPDSARDVVSPQVESALQSVKVSDTAISHASYGSSSLH